MNLFQSIPFGTAGNLFRSVMPYGTYDKEGMIIQKYESNSVSTIVMLTSDDECREKAGRSLIGFYTAQGYNVLMLSSEDYGVPDIVKAKRVAKEVLQRLHKGEHVAVHCSAGIGRTGTFLACLAKEHWTLTGEDAISWVRSWIPLAVETDEQDSFVRRY